MSLPAVPVALVELAPDRVEAAPRSSAGSPVNSLPNCSSRRSSGSAPSPLLELAGDLRERDGGLRKVVHQRVDLLLPLRICKQRRDRARVRPHLLVDPPEDALDGPDRRARASRSCPCRTSRRSGAFRPGPCPPWTFLRIAFKECERRVQVVAEPLGSRRCRRDGAQEALRPSRCGRGCSSGSARSPRGPAGGRRLPRGACSMPRAGGGRDIAADRDLGLSAASALEVDVLVAEQADRLDRGARALAQAGRARRSTS